MTMSEARVPPFKWGQTKTSLILTVQMGTSCLETSKLDIIVTPDGELSVTCPCLDGTSIKLPLSLRNRVKVEESNWTVSETAIRFNLRKASDGKWPTLSKAGVKKLPAEKIDWDYYMDSDSDGGEEISEEAQMVREYMKSVKDSLPEPLSEKLAQKVPPLRLVLDFFDQVHAMDYMFWAIALIYVLVCPYTKVEESFNIQASHDFLFHKLSLSKYDHWEFPGVVPRTSLGALAIALLASPFQLMFSLIHTPKLVALYLVRMALASCFTVSFVVLRNEISNKFGAVVAKAFATVTLCEFHVLFYCSRPLPNTLALVIVMFSYVYWLREEYKTMAVIGTVATVVFRMELVVLYGPIFLWLLIFRRMFVTDLIRSIATSGTIALVVSSLVDSVFWGRPLWPEGEVLFFNTVLGKSSEWGVSHPLFYFYSVLPRALLGNLLLAVVGVAAGWRQLRMYFVPVLGFVALYSLLPHKELRFIIYAIPIFNLAAAVTVDKAYQMARSSPDDKKRTIPFSIVVGILMVSFFASNGFMFISSNNYPGGHALNALRRMAARGAFSLDHRPIVHIDNLAAQTGVSRFSEWDGWTFDKTENLEVVDLQQYDFLVSEHEEIENFTRIHTENGFKRLEIYGFLPKAVIEPVVYVHMKRDLTHPTDRFADQDDDGEEDEGVLQDSHREEL